MTEDSLSGGEQERAQGDALVPLGYIFAVIVPFVGLVLGIIAATCPAGRMAFVVWGGVIYSEVHHSEEHAAQAQQAGREEVVSRLQTENSEAENTQREEAEREYCSEHPHAGEHMAGGYHYYECTPVYEAGG